MGLDEVDRNVYLDYNATAPIRPEALTAVTRSLGTVGNPSSTHDVGRAARDAVEAARGHVAHLIGCRASEIVFTSGATEANNIALRTAILPQRGIVVSSVEHPAISEAAEVIADEFDAMVHTVGVARDGTLRMAELEEALVTGPAVVSIMAANNETGVLNDLATIVKLAHAAGALVHSDATQLVGRLPLDVHELDIDLLSLAGHKFGGPQGVGALYVRHGLSCPVKPLAHGGGQERGRRPGTLNVPGIVGLGAAAAVVADRVEQEAAAVAALRDRLEAGLRALLPGVSINGRLNSRLPGVSNVTFVGAPADAVLAAMPMVAASEGSACSAGALEPSRVLLAMGMTRDEAECTVRFSMGYATTSHDIDRAVIYIADAVQHVRSAMGARLDTTPRPIWTFSEGQPNSDA